MNRTRQPPKPCFNHFQRQWPPPFLNFPQCAGPHPQKYGPTTTPSWCCHHVLTCGFHISDFMVFSPPGLRKTSVRNSFLVAFGLMKHIEYKAPMVAIFPRVSFRGCACECRVMNLIHEHFPNLKWVSKGQQQGEGGNSHQPVVFIVSFFGSNPR